MRFINLCTILIIIAGYKQKIQNLVYRYLMRHPNLNETLPNAKDPLDFILKAQSNWERRMYKSLNNMCNELGIALSRKRPVSEQKELEAKWTELGTEDMVFICFYSVALWGQIKVSLKVKDLQELRNEYEELSTNVSHLGVDDCPVLNTDTSNSFLHERVTLGKKVLQAGDALLAREFSKRGCPSSLRGELWRLILCVETTDAECLKFQHLKSCVFQHDLMIDKLIFKDVHLTASNDDQYFVFEDLLYQILLVFSRDTYVLDHFEYSSASPPKAPLRGKTGQEEDMVVYPPNGVIPFHGFSMYVAPLCYLYEDPVTLYLVYRELYCRFFFRLHTVSSHTQGALALCLLFELLLQETEPELCHHLASHDIQPLKVVIKWIMRAYSGYLAADQILLLWDQVLAYNSLEILGVLAAAIFSFRKPILLQAENQATFGGMLADVSSLRIIPLLQGFLGTSSLI
ncbi:TBC1 domain family member 19-like [Centruroides sculpturatus]|uniref:TBC1 domain family member 19-like n=1 Tax=Centruroides sculpturatus TaxID=218467 RepID=UPI000C6D66B4|nr:TBC1 domain family member 19-like [Centruroides sculpturatus]